MKVGQFSFDETTGTISGPAAYMQSGHYTRRMESIYAGTDHVFNFGTGHPALRVLVSLQTDYAAFKGQQQLARSLS